MTNLNEDIDPPLRVPWPTGEYAQIGLGDYISRLTLALGLAPCSACLSSPGARAQRDCGALQAHTTRAQFVTAP